MNLVCIGAQWGDEGKGKIVDYLAAKKDVVVRFNGSCNAGHTLMVKGEKHVLHLIPSGILHPHTTNVIGPGVLVDPKVLTDEIKLCDDKGLFEVNGERRLDRLKVSPLCHLVFWHHRVRDGAEQKGDNWVGSTKRGVGPAYSDKVSRLGLRVADLMNLDFNELREKMKVVSGSARLPEDKHLHKWREMLMPHICDVSEYLTEANPSNSILFEGAQGCGLDIDFGTYPYVTSSHCVPAYAAVGAGVPHTMLGDTVAITKAYTTRVGTGPFPTRLNGVEDERLRHLGGEFGATTGRPRACGWLDLVQLRDALQKTGFRYLAMTKIDVFSDYENVKLCVAYQHKETGEQRVRVLETAAEYDNWEPVYVDFNDFGTIPSKIKSLEDLPPTAQKYIRFILEYLDVKLAILSYGASREATLHLEGL